MSSEEPQAADVKPVSFEIARQRFNRFRHDALGRLRVVHMALKRANDILARNADWEGVEEARFRLSDASQALAGLDRLLKIDLGYYVMDTDARLVALLEPTQREPPFPLDVDRIFASAAEDLKGDLRRLRLAIAVATHSNSAAILAHFEPLEFIFRAMLSVAISRAAVGSKVNCHWLSQARRSSFKIGVLGPRLSQEKVLTAFDLVDGETGEPTEAHVALYMARAIARHYGFELVYHQDDGAHATDQALSRHTIELIVPVKSTLPGKSEGGAERRD